jgi:hypothetical protein
MTDNPKKLSDTARTRLTAAAMRNDYLIAPPKLPVASARQVVRSLLKAGFAEEVPAPVSDPGYAWRTGEDGDVLVLRATVLGITRTSERGADVAIGPIGTVADDSAERTGVEADGSALIATPFAVDQPAEAILTSEKGQGDPDSGVSRRPSCWLLRPPQPPGVPLGLPDARTASVGLRRPCSRPGMGWPRAAALTLPRSPAPSPPFAPRWQQALRHTDQLIARNPSRIQSKRRFSPCWLARKVPAARRSPRRWAGPRTRFAASSQASPERALRSTFSSASAKSAQTDRARRAATPSIGWQPRLNVRMMRPIIRPERTISEYLGQSSGTQLPVADEIATARRELTDEEFYLIGYARNFAGRRGEPMYVRVRAKRGSQLRRIGATDHCIVCGCRRCRELPRSRTSTCATFTCRRIRMPRASFTCVGTIIMAVTTRPTAQRSNYCRRRRSGSRTSGGRNLIRATLR